MKIMLTSSQNDAIDKKYKESAQKLCNYLVTKDTELLWGSGIDSIMGICYNTFANAGKKIYGVTSPKYEYLLPQMPKAKHITKEDTFLMKKELFELADMLIMLPGGLGSVSEFYAFLEEIRSNDKIKQLVIYDEYHHYDAMVAVIDDLIKRNFASKKVKDYFVIIDSLDEFKKYFENLK